MLATLQQRLANIDAARVVSQLVRHRSVRGGQRLRPWMAGSPEEAGSSLSAAIRQETERKDFMHRSLN